jgi:hypothetical protein
MFFRWLQDEDYMKNFGAIIGSFTGFIIGLNGTEETLYLKGAD